MMNINNKSWEKLRATDIVKFLSDIEESIFVEFKSDDEAPNKLVKEISALANTYPLGYTSWRTSRPARRKRNVPVLPMMRRRSLAGIFVKEHQAETRKGGTRFCQASVISRGM